MKKIGIITVQKAPENYGACLQCYALWKFIKNQGHHCEMIDLMRPWSPEYIESKRFKEKKKKAKIPFYKKIIRYIFHPKASVGSVPIENKNFQEFNALMDYSETYYSVDGLYDNPPVYDVYVAGSDQIWNPLMPFINEPYFLTFVPKGKKKISYASSFAVKEIPEGRWTAYSDWLVDFDAISVRERSGLDIVKNCFGRDASIVADPTMLLARNEWEKLLVKPQLEEKYLFVYTLQYNQQIVDKAISLAENKGLTVYVVVSSTTGTKLEQKGDVRIITTAGPKEWLGFIYAAEYVITDSFHGSVFSFLFSKKLLTVCTNKKVSERLTTLFGSFSLSSNLIDVEQFKLMNNLDRANYPFNDVEKAIDNLRNKSASFLVNALK